MVRQKWTPPTQRTRNEGRLFCNGTLAEPADSVFLRLYADGELLTTETRKPAPDRTYALSARLKPGLITYRVEFGARSAGRDTVLHTATNLVCGDAYLIYGRLLWRARQARITHGIRGILWHQGENDQEADGPTGGYGWETYPQYFIELSAGWKQDYPNVQHYYLFQIWPKACAMGVNGSDNMLREVQRTLPALFSHASIMSTLGITPPGGCHYPLAGWAEFARLIQPLIERDHYGKMVSESITPPNLLNAAYTTGQRHAIALEFDQPVVWTDTLAGQSYLDGEQGRVASGSVSGNVLMLELLSPASAQRITYLDSESWNPTNLLRGANGIAALTFCNVPITSR